MAQDKNLLERLMDILDALGVTASGNDTEAVKESFKQVLTGCQTPTEPQCQFWHGTGTEPCSMCETEKPDHVKANPNPKSFGPQDIQEVSALLGAVCEQLEINAGFTKEKAPIGSHAEELHRLSDQVLTLQRSLKYDHYDAEEHAINAACLWEAMLSYDNISDMFDEGIAGARQQCAALIKPCLEAYKIAAYGHNEAGTFEDCFDWEWCPWFLKHCTNESLDGFSLRPNYIELTKERWAKPA